ncbi:hypothetical protein Y1Q_0024346 [Alligator mississippiensis]|uniref:Uncharacterized protein n=1 Tax=Alligator mississippiensis TaxID=8496 RepID=A0A151NIP7_ALLMI|nr:hypothetical protein Y1Q_0024346 [Alligator mississippiensis]
MGIMGAACPAGKDVGEATLVVDDTLKNDGEVALAIDECPDTLGHGDVDAVSGPSAVEEAYVAEGSNYLLWDEAFG